MNYIVKYKHSSGNGMGFCPNLKTARHDAKILKGKIFQYKNGKIGKVMLDG